MGALTSLTQLYLHDNQLSGPIPAALGTLTNLQHLWLQRNALTGAIPAELGDLTLLQQLDLTENQLRDPIPAELGALTLLQNLHLGFNQLSGPIPAALGGEGAAELGGLMNLKNLLLHDNQLTGTIPTWLGALTKLEQLYLRENQLRGSIPTELGDLMNLQYLWLNDNQLTGTIPTQLGDLTSLEQLYLHRNQLSGSIPAELGTLTNLTTLWLNGNDLTGPIPNGLQELTAMQDLDFSFNSRLSGTIPTGWGSPNLPNLAYLYLRFTGLSGPIPTGLGTLTNLAELHLAATDWTETIPQALLTKQTNGTLSLWTNRRPTPPAVADQEAVVGHAYQYTVPFSDRDGDSLLFRASQAGDGSALPGWLAFDEQTGTLSGTPPTVGEVVEVHVTATDEDRLSAGDIPCDPDREPFTTEVNPPPLCATVTFELTVVAAPKVLLNLTATPISEDGTDSITVAASTVVTASLDRPSSAPTTVTVTAPADYVTLGSNQTMTIPANGLNVVGNLVTLTAVDNNIHGPARKTVQVSGTTNNRLVANPDPVDLEIVDDDVAPTVELVLTPQQISEPGEVSTVTARLSHPSSEVTTVVVSAAAVSPAVAGDFELSTNPTLTIAARATASTGGVTLTAVNNETDAPNKQVTVSGTATNNYGAGNPASQLLLITDDEGPPSVTLTLMPTSISEDGSESSTLTVTLSHPSSEATTVTVSADPAADVTPSSPMLTILAGEREGTVTLTAVDNDIDGPETQTVTVSAMATNAQGVTNPTTTPTLTIEDDDNPPEVTVVLSENAIEESGVENNVTVTATLDRESSQQIVVTVATASAYTLSAPRTLTIPAGKTKSEGNTVTLTAVDNDIDADNAEVMVGGTTNPSGLTVNAAALTIRDDDTRGVTVSTNTLSIREGNTATYTVVLTSKPTAPVTIAVASDDAAVEVQTTSLTFAPSDWQTLKPVTLEAANDQVQNVPPETATITHMVSGGDYAGESAADVDVTVTDDESPSTAVALRVNPAAVSEDAGSRAVTVTGELNGAPRSDPTVVTVTVTAGTATAGTDFSVSTVSLLTILQGEPSGTATFTLTPVNDTIDEPDETVTVGGSTTTVGLAVTEATLTIEDNDAAPTVDAGTVG